MPVFLNTIHMRNKNNLATKFELLEPSGAGNPTVLLQPNDSGDLNVGLSDIATIRISADDGSNRYVQKFSVKTQESGEHYFISSADIEYRIGTFNGKIGSRTSGTKIAERSVQPS